MTPISQRAQAAIRDLSDAAAETTHDSSQESWVEAADHLHAALALNSDEWAHRYLCQFASRIATARAYLNSLQEA